MKSKILCFMLLFVTVFSFAGCSAADDFSQTSESTENNQTALVQSTENKTEKTQKNKSLVIYFSATGTTKSVAEEIKTKADADIFEIVPSKPYTEDDLNYNDDNCRANKEMNDEKARPEIAGEIDNLDNYNTVFIGYPIWWGTCPKIINTLLDSYDFSGKVIIPFCTSGGSGIEKSVEEIKENESQVTVKDGLRISTNEDIDKLIGQIKD